MSTSPSSLSTPSSSAASPGSTSSDVHLLPQLTSALPGASIPLMGSSGVILGYIAWNPDRPGLTLIRQASPALVGFGLLAAGVL